MKKEILLALFLNSLLIFLNSCNNETSVSKISKSDSLKIAQDYIKNNKIIPGEKKFNNAIKARIDTMTAPTSYAKIQAYSDAFRQAINDGTITMPNTSSIPLVIKVTIKDASKEIGRLSSIDECQQIALLPAIDNNSNFTICILALDANGNVLNSHINGTLKGEETWPNTQLIKYSQYNSQDTSNPYAKFFQTPSN